MAIRRRFIEDRDLEAIVGLLSKGFPKRSPAYWTRGLDNMRRRRVPDSRPRYGLMLEDNGRPAGVLLTIYAHVDGGGKSVTRCNLSSWYTEPHLGAYASLLLNAALKDRSVTYTNISPAPHTQPIIETQGFRSFCQGSFLHLPSLSRAKVRKQVRPLTTSSAHALPERDMLEAHLALGCRCFAIGGEPFVFAPVRRLRGMLPSTYLLYCRSLDAYRANVGELGLALLKRGVLAVLINTEHAIAGLPGRRINLRQNQYVFGPETPRPGDLMYTELAVFGS